MMEPLSVSTEYAVLSRKLLTDVSMVSIPSAKDDLQRGVLVQADLLPCIRCIASSFLKRTDMLLIAVRQLSRVFRS